jgi:hypothetical protein
MKSVICIIADTMTTYQLPDPIMQTRSLVIFYVYYQKQVDNKYKKERKKAASDTYIIYTSQRIYLYNVKNIQKRHSQKCLSFILFL